MRPGLLLSLLLASAAPAAAAQPGEDGPPMGRLFVSPSGEPFRGGDGLAAWFAGADADKDGALTLAELRADAQRFFKVVDASGDGVVDGFEVQRYEAEIAPEITSLAIEGLRAGRRGGVEMGRQGAARFGLLNTPHPVRAGDLDLDGRVTEAEWSRAAARRFDLLDKAKAGQLTLDTLRPPQGRRR